MYAYYLRNMYLENNLSVPGRLTMCGVPVDLGTVDTPAYVLATREDHIVPWRTAYASARLLKGRIEFVLAASGHIAGVINPASRNRRNYWLNAALRRRPGALAGGRRGRTREAGGRTGAAGSQPFGGARVAAREALGSGSYREIEAAPGRYVKEKSA